jgi:sec-independent protein translocase protein TatA
MGAGLFQPTHMLVIPFIALIIFGAGKLPEVGEAMGEGIRAFKRATNDAASESTGTASRAAHCPG